METLTIIWIALPLFVGFSIYLLPRLARTFSLTVATASMVYGLLHILYPAPLSLQLLDNFGVSLLIDSFSGYFILTNALVTMAVVLYCWKSDKTAFFFTQAIILHGSVNAVFICADFMSLYVALEVIGIAAFLLIAYVRTNRAIWVGLRYLFVSNIAMLFYLVGAVLVYQANDSFAFEGLQKAPTEAIALIVLGLMSKGGIFVSGLWLPLTHGEAESPVSALLSGVVVKTGVFPLVRLSLGFVELEEIVRVFGIGTALLGVSYAMFAKDTKRMLAFHTVSQLGFVLAAPEVGGFYALTHGLVKSALFLIAGNLPSRKFAELKQMGIATPLWISAAVASLSISGFPLLAGFGAKALTMKYLLPWQVVFMNVAALGTAISFSKFIFLPRLAMPGPSMALVSTPSLNEPKAWTWPEKLSVSPGFLWAIGILLGGLVIGNAAYYDAYSVEKIVKALMTIGLGWTIYWLVIQRLKLKLPQMLERFEHLIGMMAVTLVALFWMVIV